MTSATLALISVGCIFGGTLVGLALRRVVPDHHLSSDSKDAVKLGAGMIGTMAALVLGLLVSSAKSRFDATTEAVTESGARVIMIDRTLAQYGPEAKPLREALRRSVAASIALLWPEEGPPDAGLDAFERTATMETFLAKLRELQPQTDAQRALRAHAETLANQILLDRWRQIEQAQSSLPSLFLVIVLFWLTMLYMSFGLVAPRNLTVVAVLFVGALAVATALFLIVEMSRPMGGIMKVSSGPVRKALEHLGR